MKVTENEEESFIYGRVIQNGLLKMPDTDFENKVMMRLPRKRHARSILFFMYALSSFILFFALGMYISLHFTFNLTILNEVIKLIFQPIFVGFIVFLADQLWSLNKYKKTELRQSPSKN